MGVSGTQEGPLSFCEDRRLYRTSCFVKMKQIGSRRKVNQLITEDCKGPKHLVLDLF